MKKENKSNSSNVHISCMTKGGVGKRCFLPVVGSIF